MQWHRLAKGRSCPVCGRVKFCMVNDNESAILCTKEPSDRQIGEAGWLHILDPKRNINHKISKLEEFYLRSQANVITGVDEIATELLGVSVESINRLGIGFWPLGHFWTFPERDERGNIIGLLKRKNDGTKLMEKGSQRGLIYEFPLPKTDKPIIIVEGATDTLAAMDMGYVAVGRPSAEGGGKLLSTLLKGRDVIIIGENDEAGRNGMEKLAKLLGKVCRSVQKILPPVKYKDLRQWYPNTAEFELWLEQKAKEVDTGRIIESVNVYDLAQQWLDEKYTDKKRRIFHRMRGDWFTHNGSFYDRIDGRNDEQLQKQLFEYFNKFHILRATKTDFRVDPLNPGRHFIEDIKYALGAICDLNITPDVVEPFHINSREKLDTERMVVFRNGMLDITTGILRPLTSDIFITSTLPFNYDPKAICDLWRGFVRDIFNGLEDCHDLLQEWFGYNLIASNRFQQMMMLYGVSNSGKSTTLQVLEALLGPERTCSISFDDFKNRFGVSSLYNKYAAFLSEDRTMTRASGESLVQQLKKIIGEDTIKLERKYADPFDVKLFCRFTYLGNELPMFHDDQGAFFRRFNLLHYPNDYTQPDRQIDRRLADKLKQELPGIANWALDGLRRLLENGEFTQPESTRDHIRDYGELSQPLSTMAQRYCIVDKNKPELFTPIKWLYELHKVVYAEWGLSPMGFALFKARFRSVFPHVQYARKSIGGKIVSVWTGVHIKESAKQTYLGGI